MIYHSTENKKCYSPPILSNGDISLAPDPEGMLGYSTETFEKRDIHGAWDGIVIRVARRTALCNNLQAVFFPLGKFVFNEGSALESWSQSLEAERGFFESDCCYGDGVEINSKGFIHHEDNIYALKKTFKNINGRKNFSYDITLSGYNEAIGEYISILYTEEKNGVGCIGFKLYGMEVFKGEIHIFVDKEFTVIPIDNGIRIMFTASDNESVSFYYYIEDNMEGIDFIKALENYKNKITSLGFSGLFEECQAHYKSFYELGYVAASDERLNSIYKTALYNIKCSTTKHSVAVNFNNGTWNGKYFAFDEYTSYSGLLSSNRLQLAKRVPSFRLNECFPYAVRRASDCHRNSETEDMARFHWEAGEKDRLELSPDGTWIDHIFHIPLIGIGAFEYYEYSGDKEFLSECYKMIRACSKFITKHMVYKDGDKLYIGKCTDMERLGASVKNPFMTACGAIKLLQCCAKAAEILCIDKEYADECKYISERLYDNLPSKNGMYVPVIDGKQKSIAVFAGKFPFDVLADDDEKMLNAWEDFEVNGSRYGNMYPVGNSISPWYACWKAESYARAKMPDKAYDALVQAYSSVGVFDEMFEINEAEYCTRPWFTTASGMFVAAVNEMLLQCDGNTVKIMPAFPHSIDVSFKLAAKGGITVEAQVKGGKLISVVILKDNINVTNQFVIEF